MSNDVFDVFLLRGKEEENGGLTFDPKTGLYLRRAEVVQEQGARDEVAWQVLEQKRYTNPSFQFHMQIKFFEVANEQVTDLL